MRLRLSVLLLAAITGVSCGWRKQTDGPIKLSGNIEITEVNIAFKMPGRLVERKANEGDRVEAGAVVARIDPLQYERTRSREQAGVEVAESQLTQLRTGIEFQRATLAAETEARQAEIRQADARLAELLAGARTQEVRQAQAAVEAAAAEHERAAKDWERAQTLIRNDDISRAQFDQFRTRYEAATAQLQQVQQTLALVKEGPRKEQIEQARAAAGRARAALKGTEAARIDLKRREQELATRRAEIARGQAQLGIAESQLSDTVAISPVAGVVLVKSAEVGEVVAPGAAVLTVGDLDRPWLRAYVNETDLGRVKLGQKVRITTDTFPGRVYEGTVSFISSEAEFTPKQIQTQEERVKLVYRIKVDVANPKHELKANMPADAEILTNGL